jgi:HAD superfamily phosphatase (TIGR01668 family)
MAFRPERFYSSVDCIQPEQLVAVGIGFVLLDVDNTIVARGTNIIEPAARQWINQLLKRGIRVCLLSNNWHRVVLNYASQLGLPIVYRAVKPLPAAFIKAKRMIGGKARQTLVVGDQLITDIVGGRFLGMHTVLVKPLAERDLKHTLLLRHLERWLLGGMTPESHLSGDAAARSAIPSGNNIPPDL